MTGGAVMHGPMGPVIGGAGIRHGGWQGRSIGRGMHGRHGHGLIQGQHGRHTIGQGAGGGFLGGGGGGGGGGEEQQQQTQAKTRMKFVIKINL